MIAPNIHSTLPEDVIERTLTMVGIELRRGQKEAAQSAIEMAFNPYELKAQKSAKAPIHVAEVIPDVLTQGLLSSEGIDTIKQLCQNTREQLLAVNMLGPRRVKFIELALAEHGLSLAIGETDGEEQGDDC